MEERGLPNETRTVSLAIPAKAEYVLLARLALSAICRLTPLRAEDAADLKLAITEAATMRGGGDGNGGVGAGGDGSGAESARLSFAFSLERERLEVEVSGGAPAERPDEERDLSRSILEATVDDCELTGDTVRLVKYLGRPPGAGPGPEAAPPATGPGE